MSRQDQEGSRNRPKNHLAGQPGAYLEQHSTNLVDWYPWGPEALEKAKKEDKPIFLSIGYASCHWCHVMEHESFADNKAVAEILNTHFVSIKVDRELRPDLDSYYQEINAMFGKSGGWPLSIFLTPDLKPIFTGTYFPSEANYGMPGFPTLLKLILETYRTKRDQIEEINRKIQESRDERKKKAISRAEQIKKEKLEKAKKQQQENAEAAVDENKGLFGAIDVNSFAEIAASGYDLETQLALAAQKENPLALSHKEFGKAFEQVLNYFDQRDGGFAGAPKFPQFAIYEFLFNHYAKSEKDAEKFRYLIKKSLEIMAYRGLYDHVGGGFHRYSVDAQWIIPHFEKMLYDNALALSVYAKAARLYQSQEFLAIAMEVAEFLIRELRSPLGLFKSGIDADAGGEEGRYHVWSVAELQEALKSEEFEYMNSKFAISIKGNFEGFNQLVWKDDAWTPTDPQWLKIKNKLRAIREKRVKPAVINNLLGSWNALTGIGFLDLYYTTNDKFYLKIAKSIATTFIDKLIVVENNEIERMYRVLDEKDGNPKFDATLEDAGYAAKFFLTLYEHTGKEEYAKIASQLLKFAVKEFADPETPELFLNSIHESEFKVEARHADEPLPGPSFVLYESAIRVNNLYKEAQIQNELERLRVFAQYKKQDVFLNPAFYGAGLVASQWDFYGYQPLSIFSSKQAFFKLRNKVRTLFVPYFQLKFSEQEGFAVYGDGGSGDSSGKKQINYNLYINYCHDTLCSVILGSPKQAIARIQKEMKNVDSSGGFSGELKFSSLM